MTSLLARAAALALPAVLLLAPADELGLARGGAGTPQVVAGDCFGCRPDGVVATDGWNGDYGHASHGGATT
ncbi:hypothetical protein [Streptomyces sp. NPDC091371]|uniref:hypothetical protein n=1 Tax=Streptomyces sp. NPDC091371 TaxID=3155303 RepID=UPI00342BEBBB